MIRPMSILAMLTVIFLATGASLAQEEKVKARVKDLTPTLRGSSGLFHVFLADTQRRGEFSFGFNSTKFHREPGDIDITLFPVSLTLGLHDRIEIFGSWEAHRRVNADQIVVNKVAPGDPVVAARLANAEQSVGFFNDTPFMDVGFGDGTGDLWAGIKFNFASERLGQRVGLAVQPLVKLHLTDDRRHLLRGLTTGQTDFGFHGILSKNLARGASFSAFGGPIFAGDSSRADRQNYVDWGVGFGAPLGGAFSPVHFVAEVVGNQWFGDKEGDFTNEKSPIDLYAGLRAYGGRWFVISGAYNLYLNTLDEQKVGIDSTDRHGWFAQIALQRKINQPPVAECDPSQTTVTEGDRATVQVTATDPDDDILSITWRTSGGRLSQQNGSAVLDTTGLDPGRYSVVAEVSDGLAVASCSTDITVEKRMLPPTIVCEPSTFTVTEGESVTLRAQASDPNNDPLTYTWTINGEPVVNDSPEFEFGTAGRTAGVYTVRVTVTDVDNMSASCEFTVTITERPVRDPIVRLTLDRNEVYAGETVTATADASHPDGEALTYSWTVDGSPRPETGTQLQINTSGMAGGSHSVAVSVRAERGGSATDTQSFSVIEKIVIQINRIEPDNVAKAALDEIALKLQQNPQLRARITGHTDSTGTEENNLEVGQRRADAARDYLVSEHNVDATRIETNSAGQTEPIADNATEEGRRQNRRIEVELFVP